MTNHRRDGAGAFADLQAELQSIRTRPEILVKTGPSPAKLAPHAISLNATVEIAGQPVADGRLVILHDPAGQDSWHGTWRIILMASADVDTSTAEDPVLIDMGWTWLEEALGERELAVGSFGGTVTRTASHSYGILEDRPATADLQIRASWTPAVDQPHPGVPRERTALVIREHVAAWLDLMALITALQPYQEGLSHLDGRR